MGLGQEQTVAGKVRRVPMAQPGQLVPADSAGPVCQEALFAQKVPDSSGRRMAGSLAVANFRTAG